VCLDAIGTADSVELKLSVPWEKQPVQRSGTVVPLAGWVRRHLSVDGQPAQRTHEVDRLLAAG